MDKVKPKKALGQHFLTDLGIARRIAETVAGYSDLPLIEVGPGMGVLTQFLIEQGNAEKLKVVELDTESVAYLQDNFPELKDKIVEADFLTVPLDRLVPSGEKFCVIGNYPYNISSQIFFRILDWKDRVECCSGMLQREVAERLAAKEGTKARGILSVLLQAWFNVEYLFTVSENVFNPPPKVKSGVIRMTRNSVTDLGVDEKLFKSVVKTSFGQRRKTLRNSLRGMFPQNPSEQFLADNIWTLRPEQLSVEQFIYLTKLLEQKN